MSTLGKLAYLEDTKNSLFEMIEFSNGSITYDTFRNYAKALFGGYINVLNNPNQLFEALPKILNIPTTETSLTARDTLYAPMKLTLKPNLYQANIKGINLCEGSQDFSGTWGNISYWETDDNTYNGLVVKKCSQTGKGISKTIQLSESGWYTISFYIKDNGFSTEVMFSDGDAGGDEFTFITSSEWERKEFKFQYYVSGEPETTDITIEKLSDDEDACTYICGLQVELRNTYSHYEPYTGGTAYIPTPSTPQPIHTITGENTITVCGKNLIDSVETNLAVNSSGGISTNPSTIYLGIENYVNCLPNTTYTITFEHDVSSANLYVGFKEKDGTFIERVGYQVARTFTTPNNAYSMFPYLNKSGVTFETVGGYVQIEKGSSSSTYEPYKGNSYEIDLDGKNLLPNTATSITTNGITFAVNTDGSVRVFGTATSTAYLTYPTFSLPSGTYTLSNNEFINSLTRIQLVEDVTSRPVLASTANAVSQTFTTTENKNVLMQFRINSGEVIDKTFYPQLEKGSTASSYSSYFTPIELCKIGDYENNLFKTTGKNLINPYSTYMGTSKGITTTYNADQSLSFSGTPDATWAYLTNVNSTNKIDLIAPSGDYTFSMDKTVSTYQPVIRCFYDSTQYVDITILVNTTSRTINLPNGIVAYQIYLNGLTVGTQINDTLHFQLEKGSPSGSYEPYGKNEWWLKKAIGKVVLDGSETWTADGVRFKTPIPNSINVASRGICYSNYFHYLESGTEEGGCFVYLAQVYLYPTSNITTVEGFKTWLSTHNTIVYYRLETPTYTKINNNELIGQLEAIKTIKSQNGQTNIIQENTDLPFILNAEILDDLNKNWWY